MPYMAYFKKKISPLRSAIFQIFEHKNQRKIKMPQNEKSLFWTRYLLPIQNYMKHCQFLKSLDSNGQYCAVIFNNPVCSCIFG